MKDGGPAFPGGVTDTWINTPGGNMELASSYGFQPVPGMSLRDFFAANAIVSLKYENYNCNPFAMANEAYRIADAMLAARGQA